MLKAISSASNRRDRSGTAIQQTGLTSGDTILTWTTTGMLPEG
jgi:hypothetical protein